jgi:type IV pilus assembly protein PilB
MPKRTPLGEILTEGGILTPKDLRNALKQQEQTGERLGKVVLSMGLVSQEDVASALGRQLGFQFIRLADVPLPNDALLRVPEPLARRHQVVPVTLEESMLVLGMVDPLDVVAIDDVRKHTGLAIKPAVITQDDLNRVLSQYPTPDDTVSQILDAIRPNTLDGEGFSLDGVGSMAEVAPLVRLANMIILQAIRQRASDIHVEPQERHIRVRYRVDGALYTAQTLPKHIHAALISRLKIMSNMDTAERRLPQDGRIELVVGGQDFDFRVSTIPLIWGEKMVLRILDKSGAFVGIQKLGLSAEGQELLDRIMHKPQGIVLLTGPTGSGKTTTLYSILSRLNRIDVNITSIEDPVEYQLEGITQVQVNPKAGVEFASALRSFLRQSPDILMVGEIRDEETARIAIQASLTGHLVLSTLHTNDAPGALTRLADMGIEPFLIASAVTGIIAQRLVRVLCQRCRQPYEPTDALLRRLGLGRVRPLPTFYKAVGCAFCGQTGYRGRTAIFEILRPDVTIQGLLTKRATSTTIKAAAVAAGMRTLQDAGLAKVIDGTTSLEEILRVVFVEDEEIGARTPEKGSGKPALRA